MDKLKDVDRSTDKHILPNDDYPHIEHWSCGCNPGVATSEGSIIYIHNQMCN
jgi:hypothetical protein